MKLTFIAAATLVFGVPLLAQPHPGGPVQMRNPRRGGFGGGNGGEFGSGISSQFPGNDSVTASSDNAPTPAPPTVSMVVDGPYLFVLRGDALMQFDKKTLKLLNTVELPHPTPSVSTQGEAKTFTSPLLRPGMGLRVGPQFKENLDPTARYNFNIGPTF